jgi:hypothetical protein
MRSRLEQFIFYPSPRPALLSNIPTHSTILIFLPFSSVFFLTLPPISATIITVEDEKDELLLTGGWTDGIYIKRQQRVSETGPAIGRR